MLLIAAFLVAIFYTLEEALEGFFLIGLLQGLGDGCYLQKLMLYKLKPTS